MSTQEFKGLAVKEKGLKLVDFSYTPRPLGPDDIEIKITHCGICHSDVHQMTSGWAESIYPMVPGHEIVGKVVQKGANVKALEIGDRVGVGPNVFACLKSGCNACSTHREPYCDEKVDTYNDRYADGTPTFGGYASGIRLHHHWAHKIPDALSSEGAAPLLCAGVTTYSPYKHWNIKAGDKVGVLGIGGLGHLAVMWGKAFGAHVVALSSSDSKREIAKKLGADEYWVITDKEDLKKKAKTLDFILATNSAHVDWDPVIRTLKLDGTLCLVGLPEDDLRIPAFALVSGRRSFAASSIGSPKEMDEMLALAAEKKIESWVEVFPLKEANKAVQGLVDGKPRFRYVLKMDE